LGKYAIFAGGFDDSTGYSDQVDIFDSISNQWTTANLTVARCQLAATTVGNQALFGGGQAGAFLNQVDIFTLLQTTTGTVLTSTTTGTTTTPSITGAQTPTGTQSVTATTTGIRIIQKTNSAVIGSLIGIIVVLLCLLALVFGFIFRKKWWNGKKQSSQKNIEETNLQEKSQVESTSINNTLLTKCLLILRKVEVPQVEKKEHPVRYS
jgi:hypothetical protein